MTQDEKLRRAALIHEQAAILLIKDAIRHMEMAMALREEAEKDQNDPMPKVDQSDPVISKDQNDTLITGYQNDPQFAASVDQIDTPKTFANIGEPLFKTRLSRLLLPWVAGILTRMKFTPRRSLWLDRLITWAEK